MKTKVLRQFFIGTLIGLFISICINLVFSFIYGNGDFLVATPSLVLAKGNEINAFIFQNILSMLLGGIFGVTNNVYENDNLSLTAQTIIHFAITFTTVTTVATLNHWFPFNILNFIAYTLQWIAIYFIIWFAHYMYYKKQVKDINKKLS